MDLAARVFRRVEAEVMAPIRRWQMKRWGIEFSPPNYVYLDSLNGSSVVVDVGCGHEAEFSQHLIDKYGLRAFGVDPTRKHRPALEELQRRTRGRFTHLPIAVTDQDGVVSFHESRQNESGSVLPSHTNVLHDTIDTYEVETVNLAGLLRRIGGTRIDFMKLDLEGAEYRLLSEVTEVELGLVGQLFVEFHHHCTEHTPPETIALARRIAGMGLKAFTLDGHNYLFFH